MVHPHTHPPHTCSSSVVHATLWPHTPGTKPDFHRAMGPEPARVFYHTFLENVRAAYDPAKVKGTIRIDRCHCHARGLQPAPCKAQRLFSTALQMVCLGP